MEFIRIDNDGPLIVSTNYWETDLATAGNVYLSLNAGSFRLLIPPGVEPSLADMRTGKLVVFSRGPWPSQRLDDAIEVLFDDDTDDPFAFHLSLTSCDRVPLDSDAAKEWRFTAWTQPRRGVVHQALERPARYRRVASLPYLKPWKRK